MADSRIFNISGTVASGDISALLNTLYLIVDETNFTDAKKILLKTILTEAVIDANTNNYQAMTPKAFYDSVMTTTRKGIGQLALDSDVTGKTGTGLLNSVHQVLMQAQWKKDLFMTSSGQTPGSIISDTGDLSTAKAIAYQSVWAGDMTAGVASCFLGPTFPSNKAFKQVYIQLAMHTGSLYGKGTFQFPAPAAGAQVNAAVPGISDMYVFIYDRGKSIGVQTITTSKTDVRVSATINGTLWEV